jgi:hypothetical protein
MEAEDQVHDFGDEEFDTHTREKFDRATGEYVEVDLDAREKPEDDFFEFEVEEVS